MIQEEKQLLIQDLCARLPYSPKCEMIDELRVVNNEKEPSYISVLLPKHIELFSFHNNFTIKPYLRSLSSMTEEEKGELLNKLPKYWSLEIDKLGDLYFDICDACYPDIELLTGIIDWLNKNMFDYRGLIEKGLALEAPDGMYSNK